MPFLGGGQFVPSGALPHGNGAYPARSPAPMPVQGQLNAGAPSGPGVGGAATAQAADVAMQQAQQEGGQPMPQDPQGGGGMPPPPAVDPSAMGGAAASGPATSDPEPQQPMDQAMAQQPQGPPPSWLPGGNGQQLYPQGQGPVTSQVSEMSSQLGQAEGTEATQTPMDAPIQQGMEIQASELAWPPTGFQGPQTARYGHCRAMAKAAMGNNEGERSTEGLLFWQGGKSSESRGLFRAPSDPRYPSNPPQVTNGIFKTAGASLHISAEGTQPKVTATGESGLVDRVPQRPWSEYGEAAWPGANGYWKQGKRGQGKTITKLSASDNAFWCGKCKKPRRGCGCETAKEAKLLTCGESRSLIKEALSWGGMAGSIGRGVKGMFGPVGAAVAGGIELAKTPWTGWNQDAWEKEHVSHGVGGQILNIIGSPLHAAYGAARDIGNWEDMTQRVARQPAAPTPQATAQPAQATPQYTPRPVPKVPMRAPDFLGMGPKDNVFDKRSADATEVVADAAGGVAGAAAGSRVGKNLHLVSQGGRWGQNIPGVVDPAMGWRHPVRDIGTSTVRGFPLPGPVSVRGAYLKRIMESNPKLYAALGGAAGKGGDIADFVKGRRASMLGGKLTGGAAGVGAMALLQSLIHRGESQVTKVSAEDETMSMEKVAQQLGLNEFAVGFVVACRDKGMDSVQMQKAAAVASELDPCIAEDLAPLLKQAFLPEAIAAGKAIGPAAWSGIKSLGPKLWGGAKAMGSQVAEAAPKLVGEAAGGPSGRAAGQTAMQMGARTLGGGLLGGEVDELLPENMRGYGTAVGAALGGGSAAPGLAKYVSPKLISGLGKATWRGAAGNVAGMAADETAAMMGQDTGGAFRQAGTAIGLGSASPWAREQAMKSLRMGTKAVSGQLGKLEGAVNPANYEQLMSGAPEAGGIRGMIGKGIGKAQKAVGALPDQLGAAANWATDPKAYARQAGLLGVGALAGGGAMYRNMAMDAGKKFQELQTAAQPALQELSKITGGNYFDPSGKVSMEGMKTALTDAKKWMSEMQNSGLSGMGQKLVSWWHSLPPESQVMMLGSVVSAIGGMATGNTGAGLVGAGLLAGGAHFGPKLAPQYFSQPRQGSPGLLGSFPQEMMGGLPQLPVLASNVQSDQTGWETGGQSELQRAGG